MKAFDPKKIKLVVSGVEINPSNFELKIDDSRKQYVYTPGFIASSPKEAFSFFSKLIELKLPLYKMVKTHEEAEKNQIDPFELWIIKNEQKDNE